MHGRTRRIMARTSRYTTLAVFLPALAMLTFGLGRLASPQQCPQLIVDGPDTSPPNRRLIYRARPDVGRPFHWTVDAGEIEGGQGSAELAVVNPPPGLLRVTVENPGCNNRVPKETLVGETPAACPSVDVSCADTARAGDPVTFTANISGMPPNVTPTFNWTVSAGTISSGQGTNTITVDTTGVGGQSITATVDVGGYDRSCSTSDSCTVSFPAPRAPARKIDEYGNIRFNDEKARLDNYAIALQNEPGATGTIICYGGRVGRAGEAQARCDRAKNYLVNERGIDASRISTIDGGFREELTVELWIVPTGAEPPTASPTVDASEVRTTRPRPRRGRRRGREE